MNKIKEQWSQIAKEYVISPFPNICLISAFNSTIKKATGQKLKFFAQRYENNSCQYLIIDSDWGKLSKLFVGTVLKNPRKLDKIIKAIKRTSEELAVFAQFIKKANLKNKSNSDLLGLYKKFLNINLEVYGWGLSLVLLDFHNTTYISEAVSDFLKRNANKKLYSEYFTILTTPLKRTVGRLEEISLLKIIIEISKNKKIKNYFIKEEAETIVKDFKKINKIIDKKIKNHVKKFGWVVYVYEGPSTNYNDYILAIKDFLKSGISAIEKLDKIEKSETELKLKQEKIIKKLRPDAYNLMVINLAQDIGYIKLWRREMQSYSYCLIEGLLREIAKRLGLSIKQLRFVLPEELENIIKNKKNLRVEKINERMKHCALVLSREKIKMIQGKEMNIFIKDIKIEKINKKTKIIKGDTACTGRKKGKVKIINTPEDMKKMEVNDILVSFATNPNLMPAIRKAGAIVTDEGGLTCHAAIVSRELNIPCVVGTKIATKVLKDGDLVEVDADKGIIRIIDK